MNRSPVLQMLTDMSLPVIQKRKLQNRAAQRAFRERKEGHVRQLEETTVAQQEQLRHYYAIIEKSVFCRRRFP